MYSLTSLFRHCLMIISLRLRVVTDERCSPNVLDVFSGSNHKHRWSEGDPLGDKPDGARPHLALKPAWRTRTGEAPLESWLESVHSSAECGAWDWLLSCFTAKCQKEKAWGWSRGGHGWVRGYLWGQIELKWMNLLIIHIVWLNGYDL